MQTDLHTCVKCVQNRSCCLAPFQSFLICDPVTSFKCPLGRERFIYLVYFHSLMNLYTFAKFGPDRSRALEAFPYLWIDPPYPPCPSGIKGLMFCSCPFPDEYSYVCQIWSRSVPLFGIFPTFLYVWPPNPLQIPLGAREVIFFSRCPFPD